MDQLHLILKHAHSGLRWILLLFLVWSTFNLFLKWRAGNALQAKDQKINFYTFITTHLQLLLGLILYFTSAKVQFSADTMKNAALRFFTVEHSFIMILAVILITLGYLRMKKADPDKQAKLGTLFFGIALLLVLLGIPWPFRGLGAGWF